MKIKTKDLTDHALDWAVYQAERALWAEYDEALAANLPRPPRSSEWVRDYEFRRGFWSPSTYWAHGGPIIEREHVDLYYSTEQKDWASAIWVDIPGGGQLMNKNRGPTPLIAAMRCFVASELSDEVDVPEELT